MGTTTTNFGLYKPAVGEVAWGALRNASYDTIDAAMQTNLAHISSDGSSHTFIDQSVISGAAPTFTGTNFTGIAAVGVSITDAGGFLTATDVEGAFQEIVPEIDLNTAKVTNVSTALSIGTVTPTTFGITSDGGADDVVLPEADTDDAGLLGADKWDEIVANTAKVSNATHTTDVTGSVALTVDPVAITNKPAATVAGGDLVLVSDIDDSNNLKKVTAQSIGDLGGGGAGDVTAASNMVDNTVVTGDGGAKGVQDSTVSISDNGEMTNTSQPAFLVRPTSTQSNIATGSAVDVVFGTETFDIGANFATNTFTAPVTGKYQLNVYLALSSLDSAATEYVLILVTSNRNYTFASFTPDFSADANFPFDFSVLADMDAADTAKVTFNQTGGAAQTDISTNSNFSGHLVA